MKKIFFYLSIFAVSLLTFSCEDNLGDSIIPQPDPLTQGLDIWIDAVFRIPYNINVAYKWNNADADQAKDMVPPKVELVMPFLMAVDKIWARPYIEVAELKENFLKEYSFRELKLIGSGSYNTDRSVTLGLAEGGYKITLYTINSFDLVAGVKKEELRQFFRTMHHEFGHILNQRKPYDEQFKNISGGYRADWTSTDDVDAREEGFVSAYSMSGDGEDFVEILSYYVCFTEDEWKSFLGTIKSQESVRLINLKVQNVSTYMKDSYGVSINDLRNSIMTNIDEVVNGNLQ